ncbi:hypothetical protein MAPG_11164 [Magnaporthiopsis poae ATCC 64411]|uniref:Protein kinase domain-containing protein n=1 Tax=Magnaporthiopsis poae (strain ATCC 64411 / 73-15) TaxID=644358 RepID=A0A0C4EEJ1_MAGP6|nr:hypothetical protein MAPG_11164 [Magnaporthiopsis poae ATCC 64411]
MPRPKVIVVHLGTPRVYFQVLGKAGYGRHHVALRVRALGNAPMAFNDDELVLKFARLERYNPDSPLRVEAEIVTELQRKECANIAKLVSDFTGVPAVGDSNTVPGDLPCTLWRFYRGGNLGTLLFDYNSAIPAIVGARILADVLEAVYAMHMEHRDFAVAHEDEVLGNILVDYPEGVANPTFLFGDFGDGHIIREPQGSPARRKGLKVSLQNIRKHTFDLVHSWGRGGDGDKWNGIRDTLDELIFEVSLPDDRAAPAPDDGGKALAVSLRTAIAKLRMREQNDICMNGRSESLQRFLNFARLMSDRRSGPPMTAPSDDLAVVMAKETFKLKTGWLIADTLPNDLSVADLWTLRKPPAA